MPSADRTLSHRDTRVDHVECSLSKTHLEYAVGGSTHKKRKLPTIRPQTGPAATWAFDALAVLYDTTGANEEPAPSLSHNSDMRNIQRTFVETAAEASDLFQDGDVLMKSVEAHGHISGGLVSRFDELL